MKKIKNIQIVNIILILVSTFVLLWVTNLHGFTGLCRWNPLYNKILISLWSFDILIIILFFVSLIKFKNLKNKKIFKWISLIISSLLALITIGLFLALIIPTFSKVEINNTVIEIESDNLLRENEPLLKLAISSDPHWGSENSNEEARTQIIKTIGASNYDGFFCLGDVAEIGSTYSSYDLALKDFDENLNKTPIHVVLGNHDALINGTVFFKKYFQKNHENFYSRIDYDNLHIITLDLLWDAKEFDKKQKAWLIKQLEEIPQGDMVIVLSHCFGYCSGYKDPETGKEWYDNKDIIENVDSILEKYNVELVLSGHNHLMEFLKHNNTSYSIVGTMGGVLDRVSEYHSPQSVWLDNTHFGYLDLQVYKDYLKLTYKDQNGQDLYSTIVNNN